MPTNFGCCGQRDQFVHRRQRFRGGAHRVCACGIEDALMRFGNRPYLRGSLTQFRVQIVTMRRTPAATALSTTSARSASKSWKSR
jgi:hypothetical protein